MRWLTTIEDKTLIRPQHYLQWALVLANHRDELRKRVVILKQHANSPDISSYRDDLFEWLGSLGVTQGKNVFVNRIVGAARICEIKYGKRYY